MGAVVYTALALVTLVYIGQVIVRIESSEIGKKADPFQMFGGMACYYVILPSVSFPLVVEFGGLQERATFTFIPMGLLAIDLATGFKPKRLAIWTVGIFRKLPLSLLIKEQRRTYRAITRWQRPWRKYFWGWVFIGPPLVILAGYLEWWIVNSPLDAWWDEFLALFGV